MPVVPRLKPGLRKISTEAEKAVARAYKQCVREITDSIDFQALVKALADKDTEKALEALDIEEAAYSPLRMAIARSFEAGGAYTAKVLPRPPRRS